jgi:hypothetical protein
MLAKLENNRNTTSGTHDTLNNPILVYALHILNNRHEYGNEDQTTELPKTCNKGIKMNCWRSLFILPTTRYIDRRTEGQQP